MTRRRAARPTPPSSAKLSAPPTQYWLLATAEDLARLLHRDVSAYARHARRSII